MAQPEMAEASPRPSLDAAASRTSLSDRNPNVFDDEYALPSSASASSISTMGQDSESPDSSPTEEQHDAGVDPTASAESVVSQSDQEPTSSRRVSYQKTMIPRKQLGGTPRPPRRSPSAVSHSTNSDDTVVPNRTMSSASSFNFVRSQSPFQGASGPSHPYALYPQGLGLGRSSSVTTSSTARPPSINAPGGPSHPYNLYSQNVFAENEDATEGYQSIPLGFAAHGQTFHRRIGPEGEELDIVGPDGHTEQLPPYTKYPETYAMRLSPANRMPAIGEAPAMERIQSEDTLVAPSSRHRGYSQGDTEPSSSTRLTGSASNSSNPTEKSWREKTWRERRRTKVCGCMPLWVLWTIVAVTIVVAIILGACIGYYRATGYWPYNSDNDGSGPTVTVTKTLLGALPTQTPPSFHIPTGTYEVPFAPAVEVSNACLVDASQSPAWSCDFVGPMLDISVSFIPTYPNATCVSSIGVSTEFQYFSTGALPPNIQNQNMSMVTDPDDPSNGPAYYFETYYDKVVVVDHNMLAAHSKRGHGSIHPRAQLRQEPQLVSGEYYWYCEFNHTFISGFIYGNDVIPSSMLSAAASSAPPSYPSTTPSPSPHSPGTRNSQYGSQPASGVYTSESSSSGNKNKNRRRSEPLNTHVPSNPTSSYEQSSPPSSIAPYPSPSSMAYPRKVKLVERRVPGSPQGSCMLKKFMDNGSLQPYPEQKPEVIMLAEHDTPLPPPRAKRSAYSSIPYVESCHCEWDWGF